MLSCHDLGRGRASPPAPPAARSWPPWPASAPCGSPGRPPAAPAARAARRGPAPPGTATRRPPAHVGPCGTGAWGGRSRGKARGADRPATATRCPLGRGFRGAGHNAGHSRPPAGRRGVAWLRAQRPNKMTRVGLGSARAARRSTAPALGPAASSPHTPHPFAPSPHLLALGHLLVPQLHPHTPLNPHPPPTCWSLVTSSSHSSSTTSPCSTPSSSTSASK